MPTHVSFAHLSDLHLPLPPVAAGDWRLLAGKRLLSLLSWRRHRRHVHLAEILAALMRDVAAHRPDHIVITGDLVNIALPAEFARARAWLEAAPGTPADTTVVPGNHDCLAPVAWRDGLGRWAPWMTGDDDGAGAAGRFPFVRRRGALAVVGVTTGLPTAPLLATGTVGRDQRERLADTLSDLARARAFRVVAMHHGPIAGRGGPRKGLTDRAEVAALLKRVGAELVLHGHGHHLGLRRLPGPDGAIPVLSAPSASADLRGSGTAAWLHCALAGEAPGWRLRVTLRGRDAGTGTVSTHGRIELPYGRGRGT